MSIRSILATSVAAVAISFAALPEKAEAQASDPYLGQLMVVGFNFCPRGWALAAGQTLQISSNTALFSLLGCTFGGDCRTTFVLPDLRGRVPVGVGTGPGLSTYTWGEKVGAQTMTLTSQNLPSHSHSATSTATSTLSANGNPAGSTAPGGTALAATSTPIYSRGGAPNTAMAPNSVTTSVTTTVLNTGGSSPLSIIQPSLSLNYCIATQGVFPSRS